MTPTKAAIRSEAETLFAAFRAAGAVPVEADILLPVETLLDLYGEDIRARAYITNDPLCGEMVLRPDFTVPVVQAHMVHGANPARYCYLGEVFRKQNAQESQANEYLQVGFELFDRIAPEEADAEIFALFARLLAPLELRTTTGDIGILMAAVRGLSTSNKRKQALLRHIWRPKRFCQLLNRFAGRAPIPKTRARLLERLATDTPEALIKAAGTFVGLRSAEEISARTAALIEDAASPALAESEATLLYDLLNLQAPAQTALAHLQSIATMMPAIMPAVDRFATRLKALQGRGIDTATLPFETNLGGTSLEYYDGFVFNFHAADTALSPIASGGRYDALTGVLGQGQSIPAVGGVIRPDLVARLKRSVT